MVAAMLIEAAASVHAPAVTAPVRGVEVRVTEVEVVAARIAGIDTEVPHTIDPCQRTVEIAGGAERIPLPVQQDVAQVQVAALPIGAIYVVITRHSHQVV
jgi:hypothetical protein